MGFVPTGLGESTVYIFSSRGIGIMIIAEKTKHSKFANIWKLYGQCFRMSNMLFENLYTS